VKNQSYNSGLLITLDGTIITGAVDGTIYFHSLDSLIKVNQFEDK